MPHSRCSSRQPPLPPDHELFFHLVAWSPLVYALLPSSSKWLHRECRPGLPLSGRFRATGTLLNSLLPLAQEKLLTTAEEVISKGGKWPKDHNVGKYICKGLQEFDPEPDRCGRRRHRGLQRGCMLLKGAACLRCRYDVVWIQWAMLYLTDGARPGHRPGCCRMNKGMDRRKDCGRTEVSGRREGAVRCMSSTWMERAIAIMEDVSRRANERRPDSAVFGSQNMLWSCLRGAARASRKMASLW